MPPEPPAKRPPDPRTITRLTRGSRPEVLERVEPGAVREYPPALPVSSETRPMPSNPPPAEQRPKLDSIEVSAAALVDELAAKNEQVRKVEAEKLEITARLAAYERAPLLPADVPTRGHWQTLLYRLGGALVAILVPCGAYLAYRVETLVPRVDSAQNRQQTQQQATTTIEDRVEALEKYQRALQKYSLCMDAERDSAIERGTGHRVETDHGDVQWVEQNAPRPTPRVIWKTAPWSIDKEQGCGPMPAPPAKPLLVLPP